VLAWLCAGENGGERQRGAWDAAAPVLKGADGGEGKKGGLRLGCHVAGNGRRGTFMNKIQARLTRGSQSQCHAV
jgi:hypothetical protein